MIRRLLSSLTVLFLNFHTALCIVPVPRTITPKPPEPTVFDLRREIHLDRRDTTTPNTCGYTSRDALYPKTCPLGLGCGWYDVGTALYDHVVVCVPFDQNGQWNWDAAPIATTCMDYGQRNISATALYSETYSSTLFCGYSSQTCATAVFEGGPTQSLAPFSTSLGAVTFTSMFCTDSSTQVRVFQSVTNSDALPPSVSSTTAPPASTTPPGFGGKAHPVSSSSTSAPSSGGGSGGSSTNVGAIAGATVGGVVGLAAIAAVVGYLVWRKKHNHAYAPPEISTEASEVDYPQGAYGHPYQPQSFAAGQYHPQPGYQGQYGVADGPEAVRRSWR